MEWHGYIVDGHNRYSICQKHNIDYVVGTLAYETKDEVISWMLDIQLGRRNLSPIQKIAIAEKYRPIYEKQAKANQTKYYGNQYDQGNGHVVKLPEVQNSSKERNPTTAEKLASIANVSEKTYRMGAKILNSDNEKLKQEVLSGKKSINAGYKELSEKKENPKIDEKNIFLNTTSTHNKISDETKKICADLKTEKSKEYLDSIWNYKVSIIECMNADFKTFYNGFVSTLNEMDGRVTKTELDECIRNAENNIEELLSVIELAKNTTLKMEK